MRTTVVQPTPAGHDFRVVPRTETPLGIFLRRFVKNKLAVVGAVIIGIMVLLAIFAPLIAPYDPVLDQDLAHVLESESTAHLMGTDDLGRDVLSRIIYGTRISLQASIYAV